MGRPHRGGLYLGTTVEKYPKAEETIFKIIYTGTRIARFLEHVSLELEKLEVTLEGNG